MYSIRITKDGKFVAYLSHRGRTEWSRRTANRHIAEAKMLAHFAGHEFELESPHWYMKTVPLFNCTK